MMTYTIDGTDLSDLANVVIGLSYTFHCATQLLPQPMKRIFSISSIIFLCVNTLFAQSGSIEGFVT